MKPYDAHTRIAELEHKINQQEALLQNAQVNWTYEKERADALAAHVERLNAELQDKALTDDGVLADAYWNCVDKITPWLGDETGPDTLINSVCGSLDFLIEQWREKKTLEQDRERHDLIKQAEKLEEVALGFGKNSDARDVCLHHAGDLRQQAEGTDQ